MLAWRGGMGGALLGLAAAAAAARGETVAGKFVACAPEALSPAAVWTRPARVSPSFPAASPSATASATPASVALAATDELSTAVAAAADESLWPTMSAMARKSEPRGRPDSSATQRVSCCRASGLSATMPSSDDTELVRLRAPGSPPRRSAGRVSAPAEDPARRRGSLLPELLAEPVEVMDEVLPPRASAALRGGEGGGVWPVPTCQLCRALTCGLLRRAPEGLATAAAADAGFCSGVGGAWVLILSSVAGVGWGGWGGGERGDGTG